MEISARCLAIGSLLAVQGSGHVRAAAWHYGPLFQTGLVFRVDGGKLLAGPAASADLSPPVARRKALQDMGWRRVRRLRRVVWKGFVCVE